LKITVNVPFVAHVETDTNNYGYVEHKHISGATCYEAKGKAKRVLKAAVVKAVEAGLLAAASLEGRAIGCSDGTVFIVRYGHGGWGYCITGGAGRPHSSWCCGAGNFGGAYADAKRHAASWAADISDTVVYDLSI